MAVTSDVGIVNIALTLIGGTRITSMTENSESARKANAIYETIRDSLLREHPWNFATTRQELAALATAPTYEYDYAYQLPTTCLKLIEVNDGDDAITDYKVEDNKIVTDESVVYIKYVYRNESVSSYSVDFIVCLSYLLASHLAVSVASDKTLAKMMFDTYLQKLDECKGNDAQESQDVIKIDEDYFIEARE